MCGVRALAVKACSYGCTCSHCDDLRHGMGSGLTLIARAERDAMAQEWSSSSGKGGKCAGVGGVM
jgi:hypothetical protein